MPHAASDTTRDRARGLAELSRVSIVTRLLGLIAGVLLLVAGGELFNGLNLRQHRLDELRDDTVQLANIAALDFAGVLEGARQLLAALAKLPDGHGWDERACSIIEATAAIDLEYDHIVAVEQQRNHQMQQQRSQANSRRRRCPTANCSIALWRRAGFPSASYGVGTAIGQPKCSAPAILLSTMPAAVVGAVYAGINVTWLNTAIGQWKLGEKVQHQHRRSQRDPDCPLSRSSACVGQHVADGLTPLLHAPAQGIVEAAGIDGTSRLFGYVPIDVPPAKGIAVFIGRNYASVLSEINRSIWLNATTIVGVLLFSILATLIYVRRYVAQPFTTLLTVAARWRGGDWSARAGAAGIAEFDRLASAFDGMAEEVSGRDRALQYRDAISRAITECAAELVTTATIGEAIPRSLRTMGEALKVDRIIVLEHQSVGSPLRLHDAWYAAGASHELRADYFASLSSVEQPDVTEWLKPLRTSGIVAARRSDVRGAAREVFDTLGMASNMQASIRVDGAAWGQLGVDDCRTERSWSAAETDAVTVLADLIGAAIARARHLEELSNADEVVRNSPAILYRLAMDVSPPHMTYVSDNVSLLGQDAKELIADPNLSYIAKVQPDDRAIIEAALLNTNAAASAGSMGTSYRRRA